MPMWSSWLVAAVVLAAFWAIPIVGVVALFRGGQPQRRGDRGDRG
jgi:hypothetical protein